jgi:DNA primase
VSQGNGRRISLADLARAKALPVDFLRQLGLEDQGGAILIPYHDITGNLIGVKRRTALAAKDGSYWPKGLPVAAYGSWRIDQANREGFLCLVEGESDCWALWHHGLPALGIPGANNATVLTAEHVECLETIYVHREPDRGGDTFLRGVVARLAELGYRGKAFELRMPGGVKDPADLHRLRPDRFLELFQRCIRDSTPLAIVGPAAHKGRVPPGRCPAR